MSNYVYAINNYWFTRTWSSNFDSQWLVTATLQLVTLELGKDDIGRPSILDKLRAPKQSEFCRKHKVHVNPPPKGKRRARGEGANEPKSISVSQQVCEFPNESLTISYNKLFCAACREELSLRKGAISSHVSSAKHKNGRRDWNWRRLKSGILPRR